MNTILWIVQGILSLAFLYSGLNKSILSPQQLIANGQTGVVNLPAPVIRFIGISEVLGAVGIIVPELTNIWPVLTPVTAICFAVIMVLAANIHYKLQEPKNVTTNLVLLVLSVFVAYGRLMC
jgi:hypothetical protein